MSRTAEEWGRVAVSLPGWRWMPGMRIGGEVSGRHQRVSDHWHMQSAMLDPRRTHAWPDPDDPATAGCLLALLGAGAFGVWMADNWREGEEERIGRACIRVAAALGRWPGGEE